MASIKQLQTRKYKITVSNGYRPDGRKISRAKTITVPDTVRKHQIPQYVAHQAEEFERLVKNGFCEDSSMRFEEYARRWLDRQSRYAPSTLASYRRMLEVVFPYIGAIPLCRLRPIHMENLLAELRKRTCHGKPVQETTVHKYLTVVSGALELILDDQSFHVKRGSSLYFACDRKHVYRNAGEEKAVCNMIITTQH